MRDTQNCLELKTAVIVTEDGTSLQADLILPENPKGIVLLVHGNGSSRLSPRNRFVAKLLRERGLGTLLFDTHTEEERALSRKADQPVDIEETASRILSARLHLSTDPRTAGLPIGFLGAGTGAAAAFLAAALRPDLIRCVVARGGRLELVSAWLPRVKAPVLMIVGARDTKVVHRNRQALEELGSEHKRLEIVPGARHLFEVPGALSAMAVHASNWLAAHVPLPSQLPTPTAVVQLER